eukprot:jgi/Mesen1/9404/ME000614S08654
MVGASTCLQLTARDSLCWQLLAPGRLHSQRTSPRPLLNCVRFSSPVFQSLRHSFSSTSFSSKVSVPKNGKNVVIRNSASSSSSSEPQGYPLVRHQSQREDKDEVVDKKSDWGFVPSKLAVFVSGGGSNLKTLHQAIKEGKIYGEVAVVVSDKPECGGCKFAAEEHIPTLSFPKGKFAPEGLSPQALVESLQQAGVEYVILAGYLRLLPEELVHAYPRAILNIHPALLPAFGGQGYYGMKVHQAVIKSGARFSGPTVHFVDEKYDNGPIIGQRVVPVLPYDTPKDLQARVLAEEHKLYVDVVAALCEGRVTWRDDGVPLIRTSWDDSEFL